MDDTHRNASLTSLVGERASVVDFALLLSVPLALLGVWTLPTATKRSLALEAADPTLVTAYASHFVHLSTGHLLTNLVSYAVIASLVFALSAAAGRLTQFRSVFVAFLVVLPFALSFENAYVLRAPISLGFSGVLMGFYGYLPIALYQFVNEMLDGHVPSRFVPGLFFLGATTIGLLLVRASAVAVVVAVLGALLTSGYATRVRSRDFVEGVGDLAADNVAETGIVGAGLFVFFPLAMFPANPVSTAGVVNVFTHFLGFAFAFISTFVTQMTGVFQG